MFCKHFPLFHRLLFHLVDGFFCHTEAFQFNAVPLIFAFAVFASDIKLFPQLLPRPVSKKLPTISSTGILINTQLKNGKKDLYRHFPKKDIKIANMYMKRCSALLIMREIQYEPLHTYIHIGFETHKFVFLYSTVGNLQSDNFWNP